MGLVFSFFLLVIIVVFVFKLINFAPTIYFTYLEKLKEKFRKKKMECLLSDLNWEKNKIGI